MTTRGLKKRVAESFSRRVTVYDDHAREQRVAASALAECAGQYAAGLPEGPVLEMGCGTGLLSIELPAIFPGRDLEFTDVSPAMITYCREKIAAAGIAHPGIRYTVVDGEQLACEEHYAMICANFSMHWFTDLAASLRRMVRALKPGGKLLCSYPGAGSYREWHRECESLHVPCTANPLPDHPSVARAFVHEAVEVRQWEQELVMRFSTAHAFLRHLKCTGAGTPTGQGAPPLALAQMRKLLRGWVEHASGGIEVTCVIHFLAVERSG